MTCPFANSSGFGPPALLLILFVLWSECKNYHGYLRNCLGFSLDSLIRVRPWPKKEEKSLHARHGGGRMLLQ